MLVLVLIFCSFIIFSLVIFICSVSLVAQPANGIKFEALKETEIKNTLNYVNKTSEELNEVDKLFKTK